MKGVILYSDYLMWWYVDYVEY